MFLIIENEHSKMVLLEYFYQKKNKQVNKDLIKLNTDECNEINYSGSAAQWKDRLRAQVPDDLWFEPHLSDYSLNGEGEFVYEWWYKEKKLAVYFDEEGIDCIAIEGMKLMTKQAETDEDCKALWKWFMTD